MVSVVGTTACTLSEGPGRAGPDMFFRLALALLWHRLFLEISEINAYYTMYTIFICLYIYI